VLDFAENSGPNGNDEGGCGMILTGIPNLLNDAPTGGANKLTGRESDDDAGPSPEIIRLATQIRAFGLSGKKVILFCPVGSIGNTNPLVRRIAKALASIDGLPVLVLDVHGVNEISPVDSRPLTSESIGRQNSPGNALGALALNQRDLSPVTYLDLFAAKPVELFPQFVSRVRDQFNYVLIDAPSILESASTVLATAHADAVVLFVQPGKSLQSEIDMTKRQFAGFGTQVVGFVLVS
jgi:hypothetical protein